MSQEKYALLSVFDKTGIVEFARRLLEMGWNILASGGTAEKIVQAGLPVSNVAELVGGKAMLGHRVVTLSRELHAGLLATDSERDVAELCSLGIPRIDLVCVDMYPLKDAIADPGATLQSVIESTDIGGPTMLRSGAKGKRIVICDPSDRGRVTDWLDKGEPEGASIRRQLAAKAEFTVACYTLASADFLGDGEYCGMLGRRARKLCYGENRRQTSAALFALDSASSDPLALDRFKLLEGQDPSYINMTDVHRLIETAVRIGAGWEVNVGSTPLIAVVVKHGNACGAAVGYDPSAVIKNMVEGDPQAISGGVVLTNFEIDRECACLMRQHAMAGGGKRFLDSVVAPHFTDSAIGELVRRRTRKCRLLVNPALAEDGLSVKALDTSPRFRPVRGGFLAQSGDEFVLNLKDPRIEWDGEVTEEQKWDIVLGWALGSSSNSNTIELTHNRMLIGRGVGQPSRVLAGKVAVLCAQESGHDTKGAIAYSDSFFPFPDGPEVLADAGISTIFASSGSIRDDDIAAVCKARKVAFVRIPDAVGRGFYGH